MIKKILVFSLLLLNISVYSQIFKDQYIKQATKTGEIWMQNITSEKYDLAYTLYSEKVKENSDSIHWSKAISQLMNVFGKFKNREIIESRFESNIENLGDGFYVFIEYKSIYQNIQECSEYLILGQDDNLKWKKQRYDFSYLNEDQDLDKELSN